jgi:hypothetical protein
VSFSASRVKDGYSYYNASDFEQPYGRGSNLCTEAEYQEVNYGNGIQERVCRIQSRTLLKPLTDIPEVTCGVKVTADAKHWARKSLPWGFALAWKYLSIGVGPAEWGVTPEVSGTATSYKECPEETCELVTAPNPGEQNPTPPSCESTPPGAGGGEGGDPPYPPAPNCSWERDFWWINLGNGYYIWGWIGGWVYTCDGDEMAPPPDGQERAIVHARLLATGSLRNGRKTTVWRDSSATAEYVIVVDTTAATASDLEDAFTRVSSLSQASYGPGVGGYGSVGSGISSTVAARAGLGSLAERTLRRVSQGDLVTDARVGQARQLDLVIERRPTRRKP